MSMTLPAFTPAQESLFLTLAGRALDSRLPHPFLGDPVADEILRRTGYDPSARDWTAGCTPVRRRGGGQP